MAFNGDYSRIRMMGIIVYPKLRYEIMNRLVKKQYGFSQLAKEIGITDGNLTWHLDKLQLNGAIRKTDHQYVATETANQLMKLLKKHLPELAN